MNNMRHELKYLISQKQLLILKSSLGGVLDIDKHQNQNGYTVRSLYFDTYENRFLYETINGIEKRSKYRIRIYDGSEDIIKFEKKITVGNLKTKETISIDKFEIERFVKGDLEDEDNELLKEAYVLSKTEGFIPKVIVEYDRYAFVSDLGNVRITFDQNIRTSSNTNLFLKNPIFIPILPDGLHIMEVKYDGVLPGYIGRIINNEIDERISYSKYALSYNCIENNGRILETYEY